MTAVALATRGVAGTLDRNAFSAWRDTTERAVFFVDAVDEAYLEGHDFEQVLSRFAEEVDPRTKKLAMVLTSRNDVWEPGYELALTRALALDSPNLQISTLTMEPLSAEDAAVFARAGGVDNVDAFVEAFNEDELEELLLPRPPDVLVLVESWKRHGSFGSWSSMLAEHVDTTVRNENRRQRQEQQFTLDEARAAVQRIAAATVLSKRPLVSLPGTRSPGEVDAEVLFSDWPPRKTQQLLGMGLFAQKGAHSVQLPQAASSDFLAAAWLAERVGQGWPLEALEQTLFMRPFGLTAPVVPASRSGLVGWVASHVPKLRERLIVDLPHVALFEGDPSLLSPAEASSSLRAVVDSLRDRRSWRFPSRSVLRQVAKHDLSELLVQLLATDLAPEGQLLLLRLAEVGRYASVVPSALRIAADRTVDGEVRHWAVRVVGAAGRVDQQSELLSLTDDGVEYVRLAVLQSLPRDALVGETLVRLVMSLLDKRLVYEVAAQLPEPALADVDALLNALSACLSPKKVDARTQPALELAIRLLARRFSRFRDEAMPSFVPALLVTVEELLEPAQYVPEEELDELERALARHEGARRALLQAKVTAGPRGRFGVSRIMRPELGRPQASDFDWLAGIYASSNNEEIRFALGYAIRAAFERIPAEDRPTRRSAVAGLDEVLRPLDGGDEHSNEVEESRRRRDAAKAAKLEERRRKNIVDLTPRRSEVEAGQDEHALVWAYKHLDDTGERGRIGTAQLVETVGADLAAAFETGFKRWWRRYDPPLVEPGANGTLYTVLAGLAGLSFEVAGGLDIAQLSDEEAARAARYAPHELNHFPPWFEALRMSHPRAAEEALRATIAREWKATVEHHGAISRAPYEPPGTGMLIAGLVLKELHGVAPSHARTLHYAVAALMLLPRTAHELLAPIFAKHATSESESEEMFSEWCRGWAHVAPSAAAEYLAGLAAADEVRFVERVLAVAALLEDDFDERSKLQPGEPWNAEGLEAWLRLLHVVAARVADPKRVGAYNPNAHDKTVDFRRRCATRLARDPSLAAHRALGRLRDAPEMQAHRQLVEGLIERQLDVAVEAAATPWSERDVLAVEAGDERRPTTASELFELVLRRLAAVGRLVENDDFSYANLLRPDTPEVDVQRWVASSMRLLSRDLYIVKREPELQDDKFVDISVQIPGVARVPVEIKPIYEEKYSLQELQDCVKSQLLGRYMRPVDVTHGVLLVVRLHHRRWRIEDELVPFDEMLPRLRDYAETVATAQNKCIRIVAIDVVSARTTGPASENGSSAPAP